MCNSKLIEEKASLGGNNTLSNILIRVDFLKIEMENIEKIIEEFSQILGEEYQYNKIDNYNINLNIADPKKLITQDFIQQRVDLKNNYEFKKENGEIRFVLNQNFFLYERKDFREYKGSNNDTEEFKKLLEIIFKYYPHIQRLGVRKTNMIFTNKKIECLKNIVEDGFLNTIEDNVVPKYSTRYTPLEQNEKNGYNVIKQLDYGNMETEDKKRIEVFRYLLDIDSYIRVQEEIDTFEKIGKKIEELKLKDFEIYFKSLTDDFKQVLKIREKDKFKSELERLEIKGGVYYGKL